MSCLVWMVVGLLICGLIMFWTSFNSVVWFCFGLRFLFNCLYTLFILLVYDCFCVFEWLVMGFEFLLCCLVFYVVCLLFLCCCFYVVGVVTFVCCLCVCVDLHFASGLLVVVCFVCFKLLVTLVYACVYFVSRFCLIDLCGLVVSFNCRLWFLKVWCLYLWYLFGCFNCTCCFIWC